MHDSSDLTQMLIRWSEGDEEALDKLLPLLYDQLKEMAHGRLRGERSGHTLGTTALVHEAYLRLVDIDRIDWQDRSHFLAVASTTMRRILVDYARQRRAQKRGGSAENVPLQEELVPDETVDTVLDLDDALEQLGAEHERQSKALEMYYFGGLTLEEIGAALDVSAATAMRDVRFAKAWLGREWGKRPTSSSPRGDGTVRMKKAGPVSRYRRKGAAQPNETRGTMNPHRSTERAETARRLFDELVELSLEKRTKRLAALDDASLRREVTSLLDAFDRPDAKIAALDELHALLSRSASAADPHQLVGRRVRQYEITEHLGGGGMGVVYKARDTRLDRTVALKFLPPHLVASAEAQARFVREAKAASALDHPHIAAVYEIGRTEEGRRFIAMPYYAGETLKATLNRGPLPVETAADYAAQIAEGLERAHEAGIVHRDVKPANVMVTEQGAVKLLDFGLARAADQSPLTRPGARMGTAAYMSPEQARGENVDARTDVWALGVLLYEMLTGARPFHGGRETAVLHAILHEAPVPLGEHREEVPPALQAIVERCLQKEPERRYASAAALREDLRAPRSEGGSVFSNVQSAEAGSPGLLPLARSGWRTGAVTLLLALIVAAGGVLWPGDPAQDRGGPAIPERSVAVLPFTYLGAADSTDYFSLGITEEILGRLAQVSALSVISRTSVMQYRQTDKNLREIGEELGVATVVEGSVQQVGDRVRIHAQLIDAASDRHLWSESYNRKLEDILAVQSKVATRIAEALQAKLLPQERAQLTTRRAVDETAYHLYLRAQHLRDRRDPTEMSRAAALFRTAIDHDSTFAPAFGGLAMASVWLGVVGEMDPKLAGAEGIPPQTASAVALQAADRALALDSTIAEAYLAKALVYERFQREWNRSEQAFQRTLQLNPSHSEAREEYGWHLLRLGHVDSALVQMKRAVAVDPLSSGAHHSLGYAYHSNHQYEEAIQELETALDLGSRDPFTKKFLNVALIKQSQKRFREGQDDEALVHLDRADELMDAIWGKNNERRAIFELALRGQRTEALARLEQVSFPPAHSTYIYSLTGQSEPILDVLEHAPILKFRVYSDPIFDPARNDPQRFERIVERALGHDVPLP